MVRAVAGADVAIFAVGHDITSGAYGSAAEAANAAAVGHGTPHPHACIAFIIGTTPSIFITRFRL